MCLHVIWHAKYFTDDVSACIQSGRWKDITSLSLPDCVYDRSSDKNAEYCVGFINDFCTAFSAKNIIHFLWKI